MQNNQMDRNIQFLIQMNYQRMASYEQAASLTNEISFREFYQQKADESEINIRQLFLMLNVQESAIDMELANINADHYMPALLTSKKNSVKMLEHFKQAEKSVAKWYKKTLGEIKGLPSEIIALVQDQYKSLANTQLQLETL